ncbi:leucine-rich repeat domain-containing protein [Kordia sp. YSTF-M3]|uniref:Leucine-rich repeat domain-containing protein n=1 Tax=Kordia aestuariivivens TaxID=2759037 RepID=A0ABR7Q8U3_9FLAO|nr:leucine-rich repeat domain-containing protein [Kordia aestuariivivens]MBC8754982.1 leucine-rich repeat domain-containing protein [Kordia aestuariivivens]
MEIQYENELDYVEFELGYRLQKDDYILNEKNRFIKLNLIDKELSDINFLMHLVSLRELNLQKNKINNIMALSTLTSLTSLNLSGNQLDDILPLSTLTSLTILDLSTNQLSDINALSNLTSLTKLDLSENQISDISALSKLTSLEKLDISSNQLRDISALSKLILLTTLDLDNNQISDISTLSKLDSISHLYLSYNKITNIDVLSVLSSLEDLHLSSNNIHDYSAISKLTSLNTLFIFKGQITNINFLSDFTSLKILYLADNNIKDIDVLSKLTSLTQLYLSSNQISDISVLSKLTLLKALKLSENPIKNLPETILKSSAQEIVRWLQENEKRGGKVLLKDVKVLLLGNTNIGKSNLLHLWQQRYSTEKEKKQYPLNSDSTHGLVYEELDIPKSNAQLHIWDFGGQEYFHATHQLFFSPDALHVLLWSKKKLETRVANEEVFQLDYWFRCAEQLSKGESAIEIVLIENYIDHIDEKENIEFYTHFPDQTYLEKFNIYSPHEDEVHEDKPPFMLNACSVSLKHEKRLQGMFELLEERIDMLYQKNLHPPTYSEIRNGLNKSIKKVWTLDAYKKKFDQKDGIILQTLHRLGCLLYFHEQLPNKVFTQPELLLDLIYTEILNEKLQEKQGKLTDEIENAAKNNNLGIKVDELEILLSAFKLIFKAQDGDWYAPQYLPEKSPVWLQLLKDYTFGVASIIVSSDQYLMNSILLDIFQQYGSKIKESEGDTYLFWQKGLVIEKEEQLLLVEYDRKQMRLLLYGDQQEKNQQLQKEVVDFILKTIHTSKEPRYELESKDDNLDRTGFKNFELKGKGIGTKNTDWNSEKVTVSVSVDGKYYVNVNELYKNVSNKIYTIKAFDYDDETSFKAFSVFRFNQYLADRDKGKMKKVAISYSKDDLKLVNEFIKNLVPLHDDGLIENPWYCSQLEAGTEWNKEIQDKFKQADIIFFMVSPNFLATKYIKEHEIKTAIERRQKEIADNVLLNRQVKIIPIILDFCRWYRKDAKYDLGKYTALPYIAKPVADFKNRNMAWYIIEEAIRAAIEHDNDPEFDTNLAKDVKKIYERIISGKVDDDNDEVT